jgi:hypothetical protein
VRTVVAPSELIPRLHDTVMRTNARAQVQSAETLESQMHSAETIFRGLGLGLSAVGGTALLLSAVSLYSLVSRARILRAVLGRELTVVLAGAAVGIALGVALYRVVALMPYDLRPAGPALLAAFVGLILVVGVGACLMPARRAVSIDPVTALRDS